MVSEDVFAAVVVVQVIVFLCYSDFFDCIFLQRRPRSKSLNITGNQTLQRWENAATM